MDDLGKVLYEMHRANVQKTLAEYASKIAGWNSLDRQAQDTWRKTAEQFAQHLR